MENLSKVYKCAIDGKEITHTLLLNLGYTHDDIQRFVGKKLLIYDKGIYRINNANDVFVYFKEQTKTNNYEYGLKILDLALSINPEHHSALNQKFFICLKLGRINDAYDAFKKVYWKNASNHMFKPDAKLQLFLFARLLPVDEEFYGELYNLSLDDVNVLDTDTRYKDRAFQTTVRDMIINYKFKAALAEVMTTLKKRNLTYPELVNKTLLMKVVNTYRNGRNYKECIMQGRYYDALYSLSIKENLSEYEQLVYKVLDFLLFPPEEIYINYNHKSGLWESIQANDFNGALELSLNYNRDKKIKNDESALTIVIQEVINMLDSFEKYDENGNPWEPENVVEDTETINTIDDKIEEPTEEVVEESVEEEHVYDRNEKVYYISSLIEQGLSIFEALDQSGFEDIDKGYVILTYAKEAYIKGYSSIGDKLMSYYNHSVLKDDDNNKIYHNIINSKKFLPYRQSELSQSITIPKSLGKIK